MKRLRLPNLFASRSCLRYLCAAIVVTQILLTGCGWFLSYHDYTKTEPKAVDVVGTWVPNKATLTDMSSRGNYDIAVLPKVVLKSDGSLLIENMPDWWEKSGGISSGSRYSYSGNWKIEREQDSDIYQLMFRFSNQLRGVHLIGQKPPYEIFFFIGDPDANRGMTFIRQ